MHAGRVRYKTPWRLVAQPSRLHNDSDWGLLGSGREPFVLATRILTTRGDDSWTKS
jgi:hypothetical protein